MAERLFKSTKEMFTEIAPELLEFLDKDDIFWRSIRDNTISDEELSKHQAIMEELGIFNSQSAVAKAITLVKTMRQKSLPTPFNFRIK